MLKYSEKSLKDLIDLAFDKPYEFLLLSLDKQPCNSALKDLCRSMIDKDRISFDKNGKITFFTESRYKSNGKRSRKKVFDVLTCKFNKECFNVVKDNSYFYFFSFDSENQRLYEIHTKTVYNILSEVSENGKISEKTTSYISSRMTLFDSSFFENWMCYEYSKRGPDIGVYDKGLVLIFKNAVIEEDLKNLDSILTEFSKRMEADNSPFNLNV